MKSPKESDRLSFQIHLWVAYHSDWDGLLDALMGTPKFRCSKAGVEGDVLGGLPDQVTIEVVRSEIRNLRFSLREWGKVLRWAACPAFAMILKKCIARNGSSDPEKRFS